MNESHPRFVRERPRAGPFPGPRHVILHQGAAEQPDPKLADAPEQVEGVGRAAAREAARHPSEAAN